MCAKVDLSDESDGFRQRGRSGTDDKPVAKLIEAAAAASFFGSPLGDRLTCIPQSRTPSDAEVLAAHLAICRFLFSTEALSPCCRVPIFKSKTQGRSNLDATFSSMRKTVKVQSVIISANRPLMQLIR